VADDSITEEQGRKIIRVLESILSELKSIDGTLDSIKSDVSDMQLRVQWIENKVSKMD
jgi:hypothetical protein